MTAYLVVIATIATLAQLARLWLAWSDYQHRWRHLPAEFYGRRKESR
jgi:DNA-binding transcriptional regulator of glucitol operon